MVVNMQQQILAAKHNPAGIFVETPGTQGSKYQYKVEDFTANRL
jgi:hypothetical protein